LTGGVDAIAILKRSGQGVTLHVEGRDLDEAVEKAIRFDRETCRWQILGEASEVHRSAERTRVLDVLGDAGTELSVSEVQAAAEIATRAAADKLLQRMANAGEICRLARGKYGLPLPPLSEASESPEDNKTPNNMGIATTPDTSDTSDTPLGGGLQEHSDTAGQLSKTVSSKNPPALGPPGDSLDDLAPWGVEPEAEPQDRLRPAATEERAPPYCGLCKGTGFRLIAAGLAPCPECNPQVEEERP
jgi:hypothetical protein